MLSHFKKRFFTNTESVSFPENTSENSEINSVDVTSSKDSIVGSILKGIRSRFSSLIHASKSDSVIVENIEFQSEIDVVDLSQLESDDSCDVDINHSNAEEIHTFNVNVDSSSLNLSKIPEESFETTSPIDVNPSIEHQSGNIIQNRIVLSEVKFKPLLKLLSIKQSSDLGKFILSLPDHSIKPKKISILSNKLIKLLKQRSKGFEDDQSKLINYIFSFLGRAFNVNDFNVSQTSQYIEAFLSNKFVPSKNYMNFVCTLNDINVEEFTTEKVSELKVKVLDNDFSSIDVLAYYISIKDINVEEFTTEKVSELRAKLINDDFSSVEVLAYYLSIKDTINFTTEESKEMNKFLMYGSMKVEIDESLKSRVFEYILFLKDKYSSLSDDTENNDLLLKHFNLSNIDEIDLLRNSFEIHKSIYASKPNDSSLINLDELMPGCFELAYEKNKIAIQSLLEAQKLNNARTRMLGSLKSRGEDLQAELSISENIDNILQVKPADSERRDVLNLEYFLNSENFPEIFNLPLDSIVDSEQRAVDKSTDQSLFEFSIWSKGKNNPNQDCAIAFDQGMVLCDGAGSAEKSELVSAFFSNFIYTYREKISSIIDSIGLDETLLKKFLSYVLAYASLEFKKLYPALSNGRSYSTLSMVFKVFPQDIESKTMVSFTIGDSPVINGENFVSGHTDLIDLAYDPNNLTKLLEILQDYHYNSRSAFDFCLLEQKIKLVDSLVSDDVFIDDWFLDLETLKMLIDKFNLLTICKSMLRNVVQTCVPRFSNDEDQNSLSDISNKYFRESELNVFQYSPDQPVSICSDGLSDNFSATGILDVSLTPVDELNSLDLDKSNIDRSDINSMFGYKNDDATIVRMDLKPELLEFAQMPLVPIPEVQTPVNETLVNLESDIYFENIPYVPEQSESINSETQIIKSPSQFALLKSKVSSWFKSSNKSLDRNKSSLVTKKVSWFEKFKSKLLTINYAQSLQKFLTYKTIAVFSIGILTYLLKDGDLASQLFQSIDSFITVDQPNEPSSSDQNFQISFQENLGGEIAGVESTTDLQEESEVPVAGAQISDDNKEANSNSVLLSQNINVTYPSEPSHTDLIDSYDPDQDPIIQNATNDVSNQVFNLFPENSNTPGSGVLLSVDDLNTTDNPPDSFLLDSIIEVNPDDVFEEVEIENQMEVNSRYFTNVNCEVSETTLSENGVDSLNPSDSNINTNISYSVNLNDEDSSLLKRDETGRVVGSLKENESFKFTGSTDLVSANNGSDDILYAEAKTSDGNTFWVARAYAKPMA